MTEETHSDTLVVEVVRSSFDQLFYAGSVGKQFLATEYEKNPELLQMLDSNGDPVEDRHFYRRDIKVIAGSAQVEISGNMKTLSGDTAS